MYSATKSPFAFIVGRAIEKGFIDSLDQPVCDFVPEARGDGRDALTFRNIMAMESGLEQSRALDEADASARRSQLEAIIARAVTREPYTWYHYNNAAYRLLFTALERATGKPLPELTRDELFAPLAMDGAYWVALEYDGRHLGYQSIRMRPVDAAKIGQIILDKGRWRGTQYLPKSFIDELLIAPNPDANPCYGLFWHINAGTFFRSYYESDRVEGRLIPSAPIDTVANYGHNGQIIAAIPSLSLVWVRTGPSTPTTIWDRDSLVTRITQVLRDSLASGD
jgi:CubicO group peptidase (beta-lactamase class C family)